MSRSSDNDLLSDVLAEEADADFRATLLDQTLHLARRRRRFRKVRQIASASAILVIVAFVTAQFLVSRRVPSKGAEPAYSLVITSPLSRNVIVSTSPNSSIPFVSSSSTIASVSTLESRTELNQLDDDQLLALLPSPALLVRRGSNLAEVVFADPDKQEFLRN